VIDAEPSNLEGCPKAILRTRRLSVSAHSSRPTLPLAALALVLAVGLSTPGAAGAASVSTDASQGRYLFMAASGEANTLTISADAANYTFTDSVPIADADAACTQLSASSLQCPRIQGTTPMDRIRAELAFPPLLPPFDSAPNTFRYNGPPPAGTATEAGLRVQTGLTETNDDIAGSSGNDEIRSFGGIDTVAGEGGNDVITDTGGPSGNFSGGEGDDEILAVGFDHVTISGDDGNDHLDGGDTMLGGSGADTLHNNGDFGGLTGDLLDGGPGNDALVEEGDSTDCPFTVADVNIGGPGNDTVYDDCGQNDVFKLQDGEADKWHCGGTTGKAELDRSDVLVVPHDLCLRGPGTVIRGYSVQGRKHTARFNFVSPNDNAVFECKLDKKPFKKCSTPKKYRGVKNGRHVFQVRALAGSLVGKAAKFRWTSKENPR
jgi:Ca2+-binding RTX toxin-like protein